MAYMASNTNYQNQIFKASIKIGKFEKEDGMLLSKRVNWWGINHFFFLKFIKNIDVLVQIFILLLQE